MESHAGCSIFLFPIGSPSTPSPKTPLKNCTLYALQIIEEETVAPSKVAPFSKTSPGWSHMPMLHFFFNVHVVFWEMKNLIICYHSPGQTSALTILHIKLTRSPCIKICREINVENVSFLAGVLEKQFFQSVIRCIIRGTSELLIIDSDNKNDSSRNRRVIVFRGVPQMFHIWLC